MSKELDYIADLERENRLLGERCNQLLKDKGELTDKIADIKANCDLAIEGRDVKIKELELELTVEKDLHQEETNLHLHAEDYIKELEKENAELKADNDARKFAMTMSEKVEKQLREQLTKAKELIKRLINACCAYGATGRATAEAEQFLKDCEVEKMTKLQLESYLSDLNLSYYNEEELQEIYNAVKSTVDRIGVRI